MKQPKTPAVYIITNKKNGTLYTGVTSNLPKRIYEHKNKLLKSFSSRYGCKILVYYEIFETMTPAIEREKQIKTWSRNKKISLIENFNKNWTDLYKKII